MPVLSEGVFHVSQAPVMMRPDSTALMVIDVQDNLLPAIHEAERCVETSRRMIDAAKILDLPIVVTEQYPAGLGRTSPTLQASLGDHVPIEKIRFSACVETVLNRLRELARPNVLVVGTEAHVCVQQTVLDLLRLGYTTNVCVDAVSSRRPMDRDTALQRMAQAGAILTTTESAIFELLGQAGTDTFKEILTIVK